MMERIGSLNPFIDSCGILRVEEGWRNQFLMKVYIIYSIILPKNEKLQNW